MKLKRKTINKFVSLLLVFVFTTMLLGSCASSESDESDTKKIAIICNSSGENDNGYNQSAVKGAEQVADEMGFEYKVVEPTTGVPNALEALSQEGYDIIFNLEYDFDALIKGIGGSKPIAEMYPDITYVVFNENPNLDEAGNTIHSNVISVLFDVHEASFLAGALSVMVNENLDILFGDGYNFSDPDENGRAIGFVGGTNSNGITVFADGFIEGINYMAEKMGVTYDFYSKYDAGFEDPALGSTVAGTFYNQGANIVFSVAGSVGDGVTSKAKESGRLAIQVDANKDEQQPGYVLTSVLKNTAIPVYTISKALYDGNLDEMDNFQTYSLATGATGITDLATISRYIKDDEEAQAKWAEIEAELDSIEQEISEGNIVVTNASLGEEFDPASCPNVVIK